MNKICTSVEQSKKLIELGIDVYTADMYWSKCTIIDFGDGTLKVSYTAEPCNISQFKNNDEDIPAWSLSALLDILPFHIISNNQRYAFGIFKGFNKEGETYMLRYNVFNTEIILYETDYYNNPLDAAFEMVVWLKENGKL